MGREVKRVASDFDWPLGKVWEGYINPSPVADCPECDGLGWSEHANRFRMQWFGDPSFDPAEYGATPLTVDHPIIQEKARRNVERWGAEASPNPPSIFVGGSHIHLSGSKERAIAAEARRLFSLKENAWCHHLIQADVDALIAEDRLWDFTRRPRNEEQRQILKEKIENGGNSWLPESNGYVPTAEEVNTWSLYGIGHGALNKSICIQARCEREGFPALCGACNGSGEYWPDAAAQEEYQRWEMTEPPVGDAYQLWETTSEGSPVSPPFDTPEELARWLAENDVSVFGKQTCSYEQWLSFIKDCGWAPSGVSVDGKMKSGVEAAVEQLDE